MEVVGNCNIGCWTAEPFGGLMKPQEDGQSQLYLLDRHDESAWMMLTPTGTPVPRSSQGETAVRRWSWNGDDPLEIIGVWFRGGTLVNGLRATACKAKMLISEGTLRIGLSKGLGRGFEPSGPWVDLGKQQGLFSKKTVLTEAGRGWVYGACFQFADITWIQVERSGFACGSENTAIVIRGGQLQRVEDSGDSVKAPIAAFARDLVRAMAQVARVAGSAPRQAFLDGLVRGDTAQEFADSPNGRIEVPL